MESSARVGIVNAPKQLLAEQEIAKLDGLSGLPASDEDALAALGADEPPRPGGR